ncbi:MAG TPA: response regulator transcription factor [Caldimonas sp.]|nr:response regulator transcription factor [Caldimonas sp.]
MASRLLIAEDDYAIATNLFTYFERKGYDVEAVYSGQAAMHRCSVERFDLVILDIGLPGLDGLTFLQRLRGELRVATPVLVVSARSDLSDKLAGFEHGADDYVTKPFALAEVEARVRALLNRARGASIDPVRRLGRLAFDVREGEARVGDALVRLTPKAAQLLDLLLRYPGQLVRRAEIEKALWDDEVANADALRSQVHWLRRALAEAGFDGIETVHGVGYRIVERPSAP